MTSAVATIRMRCRAGRAGPICMAAHATWKGFLRIRLVTIPVKVFPATESTAALVFNQPHGEEQTPIQ